MAQVKLVRATIESWFKTTRLGALELIRGEVVPNNPNFGGECAVWQALKDGVSFLLATGAKLHRDRDGDIVIYGYAWDFHDVSDYRKYQIPQEVDNV